MTDNSCSNLEQKYTHSEVQLLAHAAALYQEAMTRAVASIGTPSAESNNRIAGIATLNLQRALKPFNYLIPEFLRHG